MSLPSTPKVALFRWDAFALKFFNQKPGVAHPTRGTTTHQINIMTKQQEIEAYHNFIKSLPEASYIRPWLVEISQDVESIICSDLPINLSPRKAQLAALEIRQKSLADAKEIITCATNAADKVKSEAFRQAEIIQANAKAALLALADRL